MESAAEYLRGLGRAMEEGLIEAGISDIARLKRIADDLDALLGAVVVARYPGSGEVFEAVQRLRKGDA